MNCEQHMLVKTLPSTLDTVVFCMWGNLDVKNNACGGGFFAGTNERTAASNTLQFAPQFLKLKINL